MEIKTISRKSDVRKAGLHEISQFLAQLNITYSTVQGIGKFRADLLFSHQTFVKWPLMYTNKVTQLNNIDFILY